jgi:hypothetical protein
MTRFTKILFTATLALALAGTAAARPALKVIGHGVALNTKISYASGTAASPRAISAKIVPVPAQMVKVQWAMSCSKGSQTNAEGYNTSTKSKSGESSVHGPATVKFAMPIARPTTCTVTVYSTLAKKGKQTLSILQG